MIASTAPPVHCGGRLIKHMILEMKWLATWSCFPSCCSEGEAKISHSTSVPDIGILTSGVTMDMCSGLGTHATFPPREMEDDQSPNV